MTKSRRREGCSAIDLPVLEQACHQLFLDMTALQNSCCGGLKIDNTGSSVASRCIRRQTLILGGDPHELDKALVVRLDAERIIEQRKEGGDDGPNDEESPPPLSIKIDEQAGEAMKFLTRMHEEREKFIDGNDDGYDSPYVVARLPSREFMCLFGCDSDQDQDRLLNKV